MMVIRSGPPDRWEGARDDLVQRRNNRVVTTFRRYVAIGDSSTEGLEDPDGNGGYRGWADRLAQKIADHQDEPLEYANLAIRGLRMREIRTNQFEAALAMEPDLLSVFGGINDVIVPRCDLVSIRADYVIIFSQARRQGIDVLSFTVPDLASINPLGMAFRDRVTKLNDIIRTEAERYDVVVMDFENYPVAQDPRLWFADRLHGNELGHQIVAAALAWRLGIDGSDDSWTTPLEGEPVRPRGRQLVTGDIEWAMHHLAPWLGRGIRRMRTGYGIDPKRPIPTVVPKSSVSEAGSREL
jgi:lysophospholipase L1-like esterase